MTENNNSKKPFKKRAIFTEKRAIRALQGLYRENVRMEEKLDVLTQQISGMERVLLTLTQYYKEIKELEQNILKGLK